MGLDDSGLKPGQLKALEALLTHGNVSEAARAAGVTRKTLYRWLEQEAFSSQLRAAEQMALDGIARSLMRLGNKALAALEEALDDELAGHALKQKVASTVLSHYPYLRESGAVEARIAALEVSQRAKGY